MWGGPDALYEGTLEDVDGCIRTARGEANQSFAVVWPPGYRLSIDGGEPVVHGGFREMTMGERVRMAGITKTDRRHRKLATSAVACRPSSFRPVSPSD